MPKIVVFCRIIWIHFFEEKHSASFASSLLLMLRQKSASINSAKSSPNKVTDGTLPDRLLLLYVISLSKLYRILTARQGKSVTCFHIPHHLSIMSRTTNFLYTEKHSHISYVPTFQTDYPKL